MNGSPLSVRLGREDRWRMAELVALLGTTPSDAVRQLLRTAVPCPSARFADQDPDDPADRDTLPPSAPDDEEDTLPGVDPRQLDLYRDRVNDQWERAPIVRGRR